MKCHDQIKDQERTMNQEISNRNESETAINQ